jgi:hypothetical protein
MTSWTLRVARQAEVDIVDILSKGDTHGYYN